MAKSFVDIPEIVRTVWEAATIAFLGAPTPDDDPDSTVALLLPFHALYLWFTVAPDVDQFMEKLPRMLNLLQRATGGRTPYSARRWRAWALHMRAGTAPKRGRKEQYDPKELIALRGKLSKPAFSRQLKVSEDTISRAEKNGLLSKKTFEAYARCAERNGKTIPLGNIPQGAEGSIVKAVRDILAGRQPRIK